MLDVRTAVALESSVNDIFVSLCEELKISRGEFLTAILTEVPRAVIAEAVTTRKHILESRKDERAAARKEKQKKLRSLSISEIDAILAARTAA